MCLFRRHLDPKSRRLMAAFWLCIATNSLLTLSYDHGFLHVHTVLYDSLLFLLDGLAIGLLAWLARRSRGCASRS